MLTAQISNGQVGLINPTDYWSTARSGGRDGLGGTATHRGSVTIRRLDIGPNFTIGDVNKQLAYIGKKLPYRGEMQLYELEHEPTGEHAVILQAFSFWRRHSTWVAAGLCALGLGAGLGVGFYAGRQGR